MKPQKAALLVVFILILSSCSNTTDSLSSRDGIPAGSSGAVDASEAEVRLEPEVVIDSSALPNAEHPYMQDLAFLMDQLDLNHPAFDKEAFRSMIVEAADDIPTMSETEFNFEINRLLARMGDAHTMAWLMDRETDRLVPIWQIKHYSDGWYIDGIHKSSENYVGCEIVEIGGIPIDGIVKMAKPYISHETDATLDSAFAEEIKNSAFLKHLGIIEDDAVIPMTLRNSDGQLLQVEIPTFAIDDYDQYQSGVWVSFPPTGQYSGPNYYMKPLDDTTLFIQYSYCYERDDCPVPEFLKQTAAELKKEQYKTVIFDLRFNTGGMFSLFEPVVDEIGKYKLEQGFDLYCLIGGDTFSTGLMHAVQLGEYGAVFVGRPTGGIVNFYADTINFELPNSKIPVTCSTLFNETMPGFTGSSLEPDIRVEYNHKDVSNGLDKDIQAVFELLQ